MLPEFKHASAVRERSTRGKKQKKTKTQPASHDPFVLWKTAHADFAAQISCNGLVNMHAAVG